MHIEKNFCENIANTIMDVPGKTNDNIKVRLDLANLCKRQELPLVARSTGNYYKQRAKYTLSLQQKRGMCEWLREIRLPDGYSSNLSNNVDSSNTKLQNLKSHDYHVFMETLLPVAFGALPHDVLEHVSEFFKNLCASELHVDKSLEMDHNIPIIRCKLETIFPPGFWNVMEHLPVHIAQEALLERPVLYRWMYPFERFFKCLKQKAKSKSRPEGSIVKEYLTYELNSFGTHYFDSKIPSMHNQ